MKVGDVVIFSSEGASVHPPKVDTVSRAGLAKHNICDVWYIKTPEEEAAEEEERTKAGRFYDDGGESILTSHVGILYLASGTTAIVTKTRNVPWRHWYKKPAFLVEGIITSGRLLGRRVLFIDGDRAPK
jgi:hypothetical protein